MGGRINFTIDNGQSPFEVCLYRTDLNPDVQIGDCVSIEGYGTYSTFQYWGELPEGVYMLIACDGSNDINCCDSITGITITMPSPTPTPSITITPTPTKCDIFVTLYPFVTPSSTQTATPTPTITPTKTSTPSHTPSKTPTPSITGTIVSPTPTPSITPSPSLTPSETPTPSLTPSETPTPSLTPSETPTPSLTPTETPSSTLTPTPTVTSTSFSPTPTPTVTSTNISPTPTPTVTSTNISPTPTPTVTSTSFSPTPTPTTTPTPTPTEIICVLYDIEEFYVSGITTTFKLLYSGCVTGVTNANILYEGINYSEISIVKNLGETINVSFVGTDGAEFVGYHTEDGSKFHIDYNYEHIVDYDRTIYLLFDLPNVISKEFCVFDITTPENVCGKCTEITCSYTPSEYYDPEHMELSLWYRDSKFVVIGRDGYYREIGSGDIYKIEGGIMTFFKSCYDTDLTC